MARPGTVLLRRFLDPTEAELARAALEAADVPAWIESDDAGGMYPQLQSVEGCRLYVRPQDVERAREVLTPEEWSAPPEEEFQPPESGGIGSSAGLFGSAALLCIVSFLAGFAARSAWIVDGTWIAPYSTETVEIDADQDGRSDEWWTYRGPDAVEGRIDEDFDGRVDNWLFYEDGLLTATEYDANRDGRADGWWEYRFGRAATGSGDADFDGVRDYSERFEGGLIQEVRWHPNGGPVERVDRYEDGLLRVILRPDPDGTLRTVREWDALGREVSP